MAVYTRYTIRVTVETPKERLVPLEECVGRFLKELSGHEFKWAGGRLETPVLEPEPVPVPEPEPEEEEEEPEPEPKPVAPPRRPARATPTRGKKKARA